MESIWTKKYPASVATKIDLTQYSSIVDLFNGAVKKHAHLLAYRNMGTNMSYQELDELSAQFASYFQNTCGLKKGDRIAIQMPNLIQYPIVLFGALRAGLVVVNTNPLYTPREMRHQFKDSGAKAIVICANFAKNLEEVLPDTDIKHVVVTQLGDMLGAPKSLLINFVVKYIKKMVPSYKIPNAISFFEALDLGMKTKYAQVPVTQSDIAFLQYTGGTTGVSKGAVLTHKNMLANMLQIAEWINPLLKQQQEIIITALPLYHIFSLTLNCLSFMHIGCANLLVTNPKDIPGFIKLLKKEKYTVFAGVNTLFNALMNHPGFESLDFSRLKISVAGGMALQTPIAKRWMEKTKSPIVEGYGLTEASPVICCNPVNGTDKVGTIGLPIPSTEVRLIDDNGNDVKTGEAGELCARGPQVMDGYWQKPDETKNVMLDGGWLKTGDIAVMDNEGFFKIVDRKKDMILVSGFNVFPNEIEEVVAQHPAVAEVAAVGVDDEKSGEVVKIFVVLKGEVTTQDLVSFCKKNLVAYKVPKFVEFRTELPKTNVGKILRRALRDEAHNKQS
jgi:long-chain acyl-CoA synthetase